MPFDQREAMIRRWYRVGGPRWAEAPMREWALWADVGYLIGQLDLERASSRPTEPDLPALAPWVPSSFHEISRVSTSEDTIAMTPPRPLPVPLAYDPPPFVPIPPPAAPALLSEAELWNAAVAQVTAMAESALAKAGRERLDLHATAKAVTDAAKGCRRLL